ncbi:MAG: hypothetical protein ACYDCH_04850 [Gaiellaceae bacterium]
MSEDESKRSEQEEPKDEVEGHVHRAGANEEPDEEGSEVEAHVQRTGAPKNLAPKNL